jgi:hypothetical protein
MLIVADKARVLNLTGETAASHFPTSSAVEESSWVPSDTHGTLAMDTAAHC